jgi:hypothetical protein
MPPIDFDGNYEVYRVESGRTVYRFQADGVPEAYDMLQRWREFMMEPSLNPREFNVRAVAQPQQEQLPPGNTRWRVLDQNDREVYSFVHRSNQGEANQYAANWLRQNNLLGRSEYMVVPTT